MSFAAQADSVLAKLRKAEYGLSEKTIADELGGKCLGGDARGLAKQILGALEVSGLAELRGDRWYST